MDAPPRGYLQATVERRLDIADDLAVFWLRPPEPLSFRPGQYVTLAAPGGQGKTIKRAYSVVSAPHESLVELVIEHVEEGALTPLLFRLYEGDAVWVRKKVVGHFLLDAEKRRHVMGCTVTGIAPFLSMIRAHAEALRLGQGVPDHRFLVIHGASHAGEHGPYRAEMATLAEAPWVEAVCTISRPWTAPGWEDEVGRVEDVVRKHLDRLGWGGSEVAGYACGHPDMISAVKGVLKRACVPEAHLHEEQYFTTGEAAPAASAPEAAGAKPPPKARPKRPPGPPGGIKLKAVPRT